MVVGAHEIKEAWIVVRSAPSSEQTGSFLRILRDCPRTQYAA